MSKEGTGQTETNDAKSPTPPDTKDIEKKDVDMPQTPTPPDTKDIEKKDVDMPQTPVNDTKDAQTLEATGKTEPKPPVDPKPKSKKRPAPKPAPKATKGTVRVKRTAAEKKAVHKLASERWHAKWISKGIPRNPEDTTSSKKKDKCRKTESKPAKTKKTKTPESKKPETTDLRSVKAEFIRNFVEEFNGTGVGQQRRRLANQAWMMSDLRAKYQSGKTGTQVV